MLAATRRALLSLRLQQPLSQLLSTPLAVITAPRIACLSTAATEAPSRSAPSSAPSSAAAAAGAGADSAAPDASTAGRRPRLKFKNGFKRASAVMAEISKDAILMNARRLADFRPPLDDFNVGDAVAIQYGLDNSETNPSPVRGVVIGKRRKGLDSNFTILNAMDEEWYSATYTLSSPLLRGVKVVRRNHHSDGKKRARRAKLNYLFGRDHKTYLVDSHTKETSEVLREKRERKEAQRAGKVFKKAAPPGAKAAEGAKKKAAPKKTPKKA